VSSSCKRACNRANSSSSSKDVSSSENWDALLLQPQAHLTRLLRRGCQACLKLVMLGELVCIDTAIPRWDPIATAGGGLTQGQPRIIYKALAPQSGRNVIDYNVLYLAMSLVSKDLAR
jgi:hypothetical protein